MALRVLVRLCVDLLYEQLAAVESLLVIQNTHFGINGSKLPSDTYFISVL